MPGAWLTRKYKKSGTDNFYLLTKSPNGCPFYSQISSMRAERNTEDWASKRFGQSQSNQVALGMIHRGKFIRVLGCINAHGKERIGLKLCRR
jgi:hypothetical protein